jgi:hypothetical protein
MIWLALWLALALQADPPESKIDPILVENVRREARGIDVATAELQVAAATQSADRAIKPEVLLAMGWIESRYEPGATSYVEHGQRRTHVWSSLTPLGDGPRFCGVAQTAAGDDWLACLVMRDPRVGYARAVVELHRWLRVTRGDLAAALRGYGCGFAGLTNGCHAYDLRVLGLAARLSRDPA